MTGARLAREQSRLLVVLGPSNHYHWWQRRITLTREVFFGRDRTALWIAAHEAAHARQPHWLFWFYWFTPVRLWLEYDASRKASEVAGNVFRVDWKRYL